MLIMLAMDYRQWLLATSALWPASGLKGVAFSKSGIAAIKAGEKVMKLGTELQGVRAR